MSYNIAVTITSTGTDVAKYVYADASNPSTIEEGGTATLKFNADGTYYTLLKSSSNVVVTNAALDSWTTASPFTSGELVISNPTADVTITLTAKNTIAPQAITKPFKYTGKAPIDVRLMLTKAEMLAMSDAGQPQVYFAVCTDDNNLYIYNKSFTASETTGKFKPYEDVMNIVNAMNKAMQTEEGKAALEQATALVLPGALSDAMSTKAGAEAIANTLFDSEHFEVNLDNKIDLAVSLIQAIDSN